MFFGMGPFNFGFGNMNRNPNPPPQQNFNQNFNFQPQNHPHNNAQQNQNNQGFLGGLGNFLNQNFMNPLFAPHQEQNQQPNQQRQDEPRPSFFRSSKKQKPEKEKVSPVNEQTLIENTGMYWKNKGNQSYSKGDYETALKCYTKAIDLNNTESIFYSNRAQCWKKMGKLEQALKDAQQSVELDVENIKGHTLSGQVLAEMAKTEDNLKKINSAILRFTKGLTLCCGKKMQPQRKQKLQKQISRYIYLAKKVLFYIKFNEIRNARIKAINDYKNYIERDQNVSVSQKSQKIEEFIVATNESIIFSIPDHLVCKITFDLMEDPVTTDSGQTYERSAIEEHMQRNGKTDPFTRIPIKGLLYPSIAIKKGIQDFLEKNPWAYEYSEGENYKHIAF